MMASRTKVAGWILCLGPAVVLAACSLGSDDDAAEDDGASSGTVTATDTAGAPGTDDTTDSPSTSAAATPTTTDTPGSVTTPETTSAPDAPTSDIGVTAERGPISFAAHVEPIVERTCANCHTGDGPGTPHLPLDTAGRVASVGSDLVGAVEAGFMPPWPAGGDSPEYEHDWSLTADEMAVLMEWDAAGTPLDVPDDTLIEPIGGPGLRIDDPDRSIPSRGSYDGETGQPDEYRCFVYDLDLDESAHLTALDFRPQQTRVVHHAVGFLVDGSARAELDAIDGADGQGGWTCFGFSPAAGAELVYAWAPGQAANRYPEGTGLRVDDDDFFVIQTHYHFGVDAPADQSTFQVDLVLDSDQEAESMTSVETSVFVAPAEIPCSTDESGPLCDRDAAVAAAVDKYGAVGAIANGILAQCGQRVGDFADMTDGIASSSCDIPVGVAGTIIGIFGHQHEIGSKVRITLNPDTDDEQVLLDIPDWDFDWQLVYEPVEDIVVERSDTLRLECEWDRSRRDPALEPAYVIWADGTNDEMCFASITTYE